MKHGLKLRHVEAFVEIARRGSLKEAADALALTQPAISKTLRELEERLGARLLDRDRSGVALTEAGKGFLPSAEASLGALRLGLARIDASRTAGPRRFAVGALPSVAARVLPAAALRFAEAAPDVTLVFEDGPHGYLVDRLRDGALDLVVGRTGPPETMRGVAFAQLYAEPVVFAARPGHPLAGAARYDQIAEWPVIYPVESAAIRRRVDDLMIAHGVPAPRSRIETVSTAFAREVARRSDAIWIISEGVAAPDIRDGLLVKLPLDAGFSAGPVGAMTRVDDEPSPALTAFRRALAAAAEELGLSPVLS